MRQRSPRNSQQIACGESTTKLQISYVPISQLRSNPANARRHSEKQITQIARSISKFRFNSPILVDKNYVILAGHGRYLALKLLGWNVVPILLLDHLTPEQATAFMLADNRLCENAEWDDRLLSEQFKILAAAEIDFDLEITGFEMGEIDCLLEGMAPSGDDEELHDAIPGKESAVQICQAHDAWQLGKHRIYCENALEPTSFPALMQLDRAAAVFTDPPYNVRIAGHAGGLGGIKHKNFQMASGEMTPSEFVDFLLRTLQSVARHSVDGSIHYICIDWRHVEELISAGKRVYSELLNICVWVKDSGGMGSLYRSQHELILVWKKGNGKHQNNIQLGQYGRYRTNVWQYPGMNSFSRATTEGNLLCLHPTVKPVALVADAIMDCSKRGDIVLDSFLGSGTTVIAAERTGRVCYGMEIDPSYCDTAIRRWQDFTGLEAIHEPSGRSFNDFEKEAEHEPRS